MEASDRSAVDGFEAFYSSAVYSVRHARVESIGCASLEGRDHVLLGLSDGTIKVLHQQFDAARRKIWAQLTKSEVLTKKAITAIVPGFNNSILFVASEEGVQVVTYPHF